MPLESEQTRPAAVQTTHVVKDHLIRYSRTGHQNTRCVVFVHGVTGDIVTTWRSNGADAGFVELILQDDELQDYDVYAFGYRTSYLRGAPIDNAAIQLAGALSQLPHAYDSIVFIAHSMGGLVCMKYIVDEVQRANRPPPVSGLLLYGTPTTGSDLINIAKLVGFGIGLKVPLVRGAINLFLRGQRQLADLATGSEFLTRLHDQWAFRIVNGGHESAGPQRMWLAVRAVTGEDDIAVNEASGKGFYGAIDWKPLSYGHIQLVKPAEPNDVRYLEAKSFLQISRRTDPIVLDHVWKASQEIWGNRFSRVSKDLEFFTEINLRRDPPRAGPLSAYGTCSTICQYRFLLEEEHIDFGISFAANSLWQRRPPPVYIHQVGLDLLPQAEQNALRLSVNSILRNQDDATVWSTFFPRLSITIDGVPLAPGDVEWPTSTRQAATWLLRSYHLPPALVAKVGTAVTIRMEYDSVVPVSLPHFMFSAPWIVHGAQVEAVVEGDFEYFVPSNRLVPPGRVEQRDEPTAAGRKAHFSHDRIMLPGSAMEVRWRLKNT
ncbi:esterase/lipase family protein [Bradyrhizobium sp.]|uniref:esterase/lipase family protein n=1 Tax=Bradyrhizobium sp. TaxID=376 RepID=UPI0039E56AD9